MKLIINEFANDYETYRFGYTLQALRESEALHELYEKGFLPQSNKLEIQEPLFYLARSVRIDTAQFEPSSENRRVARKAEAFNFQYTLLEKSTFLQQEEAFLEFAWNYVQQRIDVAYMPIQRIKYIIHSTYYTHVLVVYHEGQIIAYVLLGKDAGAIHFWFSYFDVDFMQSFPLGKWLMLYTILEAKSNGIPFAYLGTCYKKKSLYKIRDFKAVQFFDGTTWSDDIQELKRRCGQDEFDH